MHGLLDAYRDPRTLPFLLGTQAVSMGAFLLFAVPLTVLAWRDPDWARPYRLQTRRPRAQTLLLPSVGRWLVNNAAMFAFATLAWPLLARSSFHLGPLPPWWELLGQVALFVYVDDFLFYWMHRALHEGALYKRIHSIHHRIHTPWAITGHYMHPVEYVLTGALMITGPLVVGSHLATVFAWIVVRQFEAAEGHSGYALPWSPSRLIPGSEGAAHHDLHHAKVRVNYAGYLPIWDRAFGTYASPEHRG